MKENKKESFFEAVKNGGEITNKIFQNEKINTAICAFILIAACFLLYFKVINFGYTEIDDYNSIVTCAPSYEQEYSLLKAFKTNVMFDKFPSPYYRPIIACAFIIQNKIAGPSSKLAHFSTIFMHSLCVLVMFFFLKRNLFKTEISFLAALLFAVCPGAMYGAVWITGIQESIGILFFILSLAFFIEYLKGVGRQKQIFLTGHVLCMIVCFFTRESAVSYPFIFLFYYFLSKDAKQKIQIRCYVLWAASMAFFFYMRKLAGNSGGIPLSLHISPDNSVMMFDYYTTLVFLKTPFAATISMQKYILGSIAIILCFIFAFFEGKKLKFNKINLFYFLLPMLIAAPSITAGDRFWFQGNRIYPMSFGFVVIVFTFLKYFIENKKTKIFTFCGVLAFIVLCAYTSYTRADVFKNGLSFNGEIVKEDPKHIQARKFHALAHLKNGNIKDTIEELAALNRDINYSFDETNYHLAFWLLINGNYGESAKVFELMINKGQTFNAQVFAGAFLSNYLLGQKEKAQEYAGLLMKAANVTPQQAQQYINGYFSYIKEQREDIFGKIIIKDN
ncbi:MAG: hypothetical protein LBU09_03660 [Endomicrobium sp.]|jgi:hypothetical protein|nr:hypothetical protein [Endomicrobium sp.]